MLQILRWITLLALWLSLSPIQSSSPLGNAGGWFGSNSEKKQWSSMLEVDPSIIISLMVKHGGLLIPESSKKDLDVLAKVCHADSVQLNILQRKLEVNNFIVQLPGEEEVALRIGRMYLNWDSYLKPCMEIEVDNVYILVEFFNLILTQTNWDALKKIGFPPVLLDDSTPNNQNRKSNKDTSFVRIGRIDLSGDVIAKLKSRPLQKDLAEVKFDLDTFDSLDDQIKIQSLENLAGTGRRGCTTDELYVLIRNYIGGILMQVLADIFEDVTTGGSATLEKVERVVNLTKKSVSEYVNDTTDWSGRILQEKMAERLKKWGIRNDTVQNKQAISMLAKQLLQSSDGFLSRDERLQYVYKNILRKQKGFGDKDDSPDTK